MNCEAGKIRRMRVGNKKKNGANKGRWRERTISQYCVYGWRSPHCFPPKASRGLCCEYCQHEGQQLDGNQRQLKDVHPFGPSEECVGKGRSRVGKGSSLEYPGKLEMPWPSSGGGCGCP